MNNRSTNSCMAFEVMLKGWCLGGAYFFAEFKVRELIEVVLIKKACITIYNITTLEL